MNKYCSAALLSKGAPSTVVHVEASTCTLQIKISEDILNDFLPSFPPLTDSQQCQP